MRASRPDSFDPATPVIVLAGQENSLAVVRNLGRLGVDITVSGPTICWALYSRYCKRALTIPDGVDLIEHWHELLLGTDSDAYHGSLLIAGNDDAIEFFAKYENALRERYILEEFDAELHLVLLNKQKTVELAEAAGVPAPQQFRVKTLEDVDALRTSIELPAMIKALNTHEFNRIIGSKVLVAEDSFDELRDHAKRAFDANLDVMVVEMIPGEDDQLCSYFTYITENGERLYDFTKSVVRRYPLGYGAGACHVTKWQPDVAEMGRRFFEHIGFRGTGNIEFKRDGSTLKIIEVNARYVASHELIVRSGAPLDVIAYCHLTGQPAPLFSSYEEGRYLWSPIADVLAMLALRRTGKLTVIAWAQDIATHRITFPVFQVSDPYPSVHHGLSLLGKCRDSLLRFAGRLGKRFSLKKSDAELQIPSRVRSYRRVK